MKKILFDQNESSFNLFLIFPILICISIGCYLGESKKITNNCVSADGKNLVFSLRDKQRVLDLSTGQEISQENLETSQTVCTQDNEVINLNEKTVFVGNNDDKKSQIERTALWKYSGKTYQFPPAILSQRHALLGHQVIGFIRKQYLVSSSREYLNESVRTRNKITIFYKTYPTPHVFSLDDTKTGKVTNHVISVEKLGLDKSFEDKYLRIHPLNVTEESILNFVADTQFDTPRFYALDLFNGKITQNSKIQLNLGNLIPRDKERVLDRDFTVVADRTGKFAAFIYWTFDKQNEKESFIKVFNLETSQEILSRNYGKIIFDENSKKVAVIAEKFRSPDDIKTSYTEIIVFDLQNGSQIAEFDSDQMFKEAMNVGLLGIVGDEMIVFHTYYEPMVWKGDKVRLCKMNLLTKQVVWDVELN